MMNVRTYLIAGAVMVILVVAFLWLPYHDRQVRANTRFAEVTDSLERVVKSEADSAAVLATARARRDTLYVHDTVPVYRTHVAAVDSAGVFARYVAAHPQDSVMPVAVAASAVRACTLDRDNQLRLRTECEARVLDRDRQIANLKEQLSTSKTQTSVMANAGGAKRWQLYGGAGGDLVSSSLGAHVGTSLRLFGPLMADVSAQYLNRDSTHVRVMGWVNVRF